MSTQPSSITWGRTGQSNEASSDLQQVLARVLAILSHRRWAFIFPLLTGTLLALLISLYLPRRYVLSTLFERRDDVVITNLVSNNSPYSFETLRRSLNVDLVGYNALTEAVESLGLDRDLPRDANGELTPEGKAAKTAMIGGFARQLEVTLAEKSTYLDLIDLRYTGPNPRLGTQLVARLKDNYIKRTRERIAHILTKSHDFFSQEAGKRRERVAKMQAELLLTAVQHPGVDPNDPTILDQRLLAETQTVEDLERRRTEIQSKLATCEEYLQQINGTPAHGATSRPAMLLPNTVPNPRRQRLAQEIEKVEAEIADARALKKMTDLHPTVVGLRQKLETLQREAEGVPAVLPAEQRVFPDAPVNSPLDAERRRVQMEMKSLTDAMKQLEPDIARHQKEKTRLEEEKGNLFERRQSYVIAEQALQSAKSDLQVWEGHVETISRVMTAEVESRGIQFATVDDARRPAKPISPTLFGVLLVSLATGVGLGVATLFLCEILDRSFRNAHRVRQALGIPVLETIGEIRVGRSPRWISCGRIMPLLASAEGLMVLGAGFLAYLSVEKPLVYEQVAAHAATVWPLPAGANLGSN